MGSRLIGSNLHGTCHSAYLDSDFNLVSEGFFFAVDLAREGVSSIGIFVKSH